MSEADKLPQNSLNSFPPVSEAESGQKLLRFLERRLGLPQNLLHRWLRTGQIRLNGKRCKPFELIQTGDSIRLPPFAQKLAQTASNELPDLPGPKFSPPLLESYKGIWAFNKPSGLPVQNGSGHLDSLASRLATEYAHLAFRPAPAHRLDLETSGVLLAGATFAALQKLQADFQAGKIHKEYLAWVSGHWPHDQEILLHHWLSGKDKVIAKTSPSPDSSEALCLARPLEKAKDKSLLHIHLLTGKKRQIRAQLAATGHALIGDSRYSQNPDSGLKLHACRIILPDGHEISCLPVWQNKFKIDCLPERFPKREIPDIASPSAD